MILYLGGLPVCEFHDPTIAKGKVVGLGPPFGSNEHPLKSYVWAVFSTGPIVHVFTRVLPDYDPKNAS